MGLVTKSIELTEDINGFLKDISGLSEYTNLAFLIIKGNMLISRTKLLMEDLEKAAEDESIKLTAMQAKKALEIELNGLIDVVNSLKSADSAVILSKQALLEAKIKEIKERAL